MHCRYDKTRLNNYTTTSYLEPVEIKYLSPRVNIAESKIFNRLSKNRMKPNREFFKIENLKEVIDIIENHQ